MSTTMRSLPALILCSTVLLLASGARADDTKPPAISDVKVSSKGSSVHIEAKITDETGVLQATVFFRKGGGKWNEQAMVKNDFDDTFKATLSGSADEYYIQAGDLLGNGPSSYGAAGKPMAIGGGKGRKSEPAEAVAAATPPPPPPPPAAAEPPPPRRERPAKVAAATAPPPPPPAEEKPKHTKSSAPPAISHRAPRAALPDGTPVTLRIIIKSEVGIDKAAIFVRPAGAATWAANVPLKNVDGESWSVEVPGNLAHGDVEYLVVAKDTNGQQVNQGDGGPVTPFKISFKTSQPTPSGPPAQPFAIAHTSPGRVAPNKPVVLRAQVSPANLDTLSQADAAAAEAKVAGVKAQLLYRGQDATDQVQQMQADPSGGLGGFLAELPPQFEGDVIYYQVVACAGDECAIDTASKKKWNALVVSAKPVAPPPSIDAVSSRAPANLPE